MLLAWFRFSQSIAFLVSQITESTLIGSWYAGNLPDKQIWISLVIEKIQRPVLENEFNFFLHNNILEGLFWHAAGIGCLCKKANLLDQKEVQTDKNKVTLISSLGLSNRVFIYVFNSIFPRKLLDKFEFRVHEHLDLINKADGLTNRKQNLSLG